MEKAIPALDGSLTSRLGRLERAVDCGGCIRCLMGRIDEPPVTGTQETVADLKAYSRVESGTMRGHWRATVGRSGASGLTIERRRRRNTMTCALRPCCARRGADHGHCLRQAQARKVTTPGDTRRVPGFAFGHAVGGQGSGIRNQKSDTPTVRLLRPVGSADSPSGLAGYWSSRVQMSWPISSLGTVRT